MESDLRKVRFENKRLSSLGIESLTLASIRSKMSSELIRRAERLELYVLIFVTRGRGHHMVDFHEYQLSSGSVLFIQPGQVQQWRTDRSYDADIVLFDPVALRSPDAWQAIGEHSQLSILQWQPMLVLKGAARSQFSEDICRLTTDFLNYDQSEIDNGLIRAQLTVLLMRLARLQRDMSDQSGASFTRRRRIFIEFIHELENHFSRQHSVRYYVNRLGYSESTLNRASRAERGYAAKAVIDKRIVLESQRLLAHSDLSVAEISYHLGFSEATNFSKFFRRLIGMTPLQFRENKK